MAANPHRHGPWLHHLDVIQGDAEAQLQVFLEKVSQALNQWTRGQPYGDAVQEFVGAKKKVHSISLSHLQ